MTQLYYNATGWSYWARRTGEATWAAAKGASGSNSDGQGNTAALYTSFTTTYNVQRTFIRFYLPAEFPTSIESAVLRLWVSSFTPGSGIQVLRSAYDSSFPAGNFNNYYEPFANTTTVSGYNYLTFNQAGIDYLQPLASRT